MIGNRPSKSAIEQNRGRLMQDDTGAPAERLRRQQKALAEFGLHAFGSRDLDDLLHRAAELVADGLDVRRAKVLELLPDGDELLMRAGVGWNPGVVGTVRFGANSDSPAGYALSHDEPVVSPDLATEDRFRIPQVLIDHGIQSMVNVIIAGEDGPFGVLEVDDTRPRDFASDDIAFLRNYANLLAAAVERHRSHRTLEESNSEQKLLVQELAHRVKNMLGIVHSLATQTTAEHPAARDFQEVFLGRLRALARAEDLVFEDHAQVVDLARLVARSVEPFKEAGHGSIVAEGASVRLPARSGRIIGLVLHELATNATKYGALSEPEGRVEIAWAVEPSGEGKQIRLRWIEQDGPPVDAPERKGFGTKLITTLAAYELEGQAQLEHPQDGLEYQLVFTVEG